MTDGFRLIAICLLLFAYVCYGMGYTKEYIISRLKELKPSLQRKYPISEIGLFGSFARDENEEDSDIDILVDFNGTIGLGFFRLVNELEKEFKTKVDVVYRKGVKSHYLPYIEKNLTWI